MISCNLATLNKNLTYDELKRTKNLEGNDLTVRFCVADGPGGAVNDYKCYQSFGNSRVTQSMPYDVMYTGMTECAEYYGTLCTLQFWNDENYNYRSELEKYLKISEILKTSYPNSKSVAASGIRFGKRSRLFSNL